MDNHLEGRDGSPAVARRLGALLFAASEAAQIAGSTALEPLGVGVKHFGVLTFVAHEEAGAPAGSAQPDRRNLSGNFARNRSNSA